MRITFAVKTELLTYSMALSVRRIGYGASVIMISSQWYVFFFFSSRRRHTRYWRDWSSDVCSSDLGAGLPGRRRRRRATAVPPPPDRRPPRHTLPSAAGRVRRPVLDRDGGRAGHQPADRKSVVEGKSVDLGGRRIIKKKKKHNRLYN